MQTELNKKVSLYLDKHSLGDITVDTIRKNFGDINISNPYGGILHALVHNRYDEKKCLKMMRILCSLGIDVNLRGKNTGYNFIQLALYGYTDKNTDYSYTTDFIIKLIRLAKKYNFDVNLTDLDQDTIIHTALASEVYTGSVLPLVNELGSSFDITKKDNRGNDIYNALLCYKAEATRDKNRGWLRRLTEEEEKIKLIVEKVDIEEIDKKLKEIKLSLDNLTNNISIKALVNDYNSVKELGKELNFYLKKEEILERGATIYSGLDKVYLEKIGLFVDSYIKTLKDEPNLKQMNSLEDILAKFVEKNIFGGELDFLRQIKDGYLNRVSGFKKLISTSETLTKLMEMEKGVSSFSDKDVQLELLGVIDANRREFVALIDGIGQKKEMIDFVTAWMLEHRFLNFKVEVSNETDERNKTKSEDVDYSRVKKSDLKKCYEVYEENLLGLKQEIDLRTREFFQAYSCLVERKIVEKDSLVRNLSEVLLEESIDLKKREKKRERGK